MRCFLRSLERDKEAVLATLYKERNTAAFSYLPDRLLEIADRGDLLAVDLLDQVTDVQSSIIRRTARIDPGNDHAMRVLVAELIGKVLIERLQGKAKFLA